MGRGVPGVDGMPADDPLPPKALQRRRFLLLNRQL
jgi:hypothetical protein